MVDSLGGDPDDITRQDGGGRFLRQNWAQKSLRAFDSLYYLFMIQLCRVLVVVQLFE